MPLLGAGIPKIASPSDESVIEAVGLTQKTLIRDSFHGVDLDIRRGETFAICGLNGSGKTALLLTLAGRMRFTKGELTVLGHRLPKGRDKVQRRVSLGLFYGLNDLQESMTVANQVGAEFELYGRKAKKEAVAAYLAAWYLDGEADTLIKDLVSTTKVRLGIALAYVSDPEIIIVDDIEAQITKEQSIGIYRYLDQLAHEKGVTIVFGCIERDIAQLADGVCYLEKEGE